MLRCITKRLECPSARFIEFAVELNILKSCAVYECAERIDRKIEQVKSYQQYARDQRAQNLQNDIR